MTMVALINDAMLRVITAASELRARLAEERGQDMLEYALLGGLVAAALVAAAFLLSDAVVDMFTGIAYCIDFDSGTICSPPVP